MSNNKHSFSIKLSPSRIFELVIDPFAFSSAIYMALRVKVAKFVVSKVSTLLRFINTLAIKKIKFTITDFLVKLSLRLPMTLSVKKVKLTAVWKELYRVLQTLSVKRMKFVVAMRQLLRVPIANLKVYKARIVANAVVAIFYALSHWDPYYLSDLDSKNLTELDYTS